MKTKVVIEVDLPAHVFGVFDGDVWVWAKTEDEDGEDANSVVSKKLHCSPELVEAISSAFTMITEAVEAQLVEVWKRMDKLEGRN